MLLNRSHVSALDATKGDPREADGALLARREAEIQARDAHRSAMVLTLLVFLWGALSLWLVPWHPFWIANLAQTIVSAGALAYFLRTWNRPQPQIADAFAAVIIVYALVLLPWTTVAWSELGRPSEAFTVPQLAMVSTALVFRRRLALDIVVLGLFAAESVFASVYPRHLGLDALVPISEPYATLAFALLSFGLISLRRHRRDLALEHIRVQAEIQTLDRLRPLLSNARDQLAAEGAALADEIRGADQEHSNALSRAMAGAVDKLGDLGGKLGSLLADEGGIPPVRETEQRLLARDAQFGATVLVAITVALGLPAIAWSHVELADALTPLFVAKATFDLLLLAYLTATRHRPSARRALWAVVAGFMTALPLVTYNQWLLFEMGRPYSPFLGYKLMMVALGLTVTSRSKLGVVLIVITALTAIAFWFILDLGAHRDIISVAEPWVTLVYMLIGLLSLRNLEQRRLASIRLLRADAEAAALHRRALMFLSLRDRLNSPLQTLVLGADCAPSAIAPNSIDRVHLAVDRLVTLSRELADLDVLIPPTSHLGFDADAELHRADLLHPHGRA